MMRATIRRWATALLVIGLAASTSSCGSGLRAADVPWTGQDALVVVAEHDAVWLAGIDVRTGAVNPLAELPVSVDAGVMPEASVLGSGNRRHITVAVSAEAADVFSIDIAAQRVERLGRIDAGRTPFLSGSTLVGATSQGTAVRYSLPELTEQDRADVDGAPTTSGSGCLATSTDRGSGTRSLQAFTPAPGRSLVLRDSEREITSTCHDRDVAAAGVGAHGSWYRSSAAGSRTTEIPGEIRAVAVPHGVTRPMFQTSNRFGQGRLVTLSAAGAVRKYADLPDLEPAMVMTAAADGWLVVATVAAWFVSEANQAREMRLPAQNVTVAINPSG